MATIGDVARRAGVSRTAVSFAFNKPEQLAEETLRRILDVAHELGYYPNPAARSLNTGRTGILGVLIPQRAAIVCSNPFMLEFLKGIGYVSDRHGLTIMLVSPVQGSLTRAMNCVAVDGFIALGLGYRHHEVDLLRRRKVPFVVVDALAPDDVASVVVDDVDGAAAAARHVLAAGHRDIAVLAIHPAPEDGAAAVVGAGMTAGVTAGVTTGTTAGVEMYDVLHRRLHGYARAFEERGLAVPSSPERLIHVECTIEGGARALGAALRGGVPPSAVLAMSDALAMGALRKAREVGLRVPEDLSIVGFDDVDGAALTAPALTTVQQPIAEKGRQAAELLVASLNGMTMPVRRILPTRLVVRQSVATCRSGR